MRRRHRPIRRSMAAGSDHKLHWLEQPRSSQATVTGLQLLVAAELIDRLGSPAFAKRRALALDDHQRDAVDQQYDVGPDVLLAALDAELPGNDEVITRGVREVEELLLLALLDVA